MTDTDHLSRALERVQVYREVKFTLLPHQESMIAMADEIERLTLERDALERKVGLWIDRDRSQCELLQSMQAALAAIRNRLRSDPMDYETALGDVQFAYHAANRVLNGEQAAPEVGHCCGCAIGLELADRVHWHNGEAIADCLDLPDATALASLYDIPRHLVTRELLWAEVERLRAVLMRINAVNDNPARFSEEIDRLSTPPYNEALAKGGDAL